MGWWGEHRGPAGAAEQPRATARLREPGPAGRGAESCPPAAARTEDDRTLLQRVRSRILDTCADLDERAESEAARRICASVLAELPAARRDRLTDEVMAQLGGRLGPIQPHMDDPEVTEVMINAPDNVFVERRGKLSLTGTAFRDDGEVQGLVERVVGRVGRRFDRGNPMVDARLPDGSRINAIRPELALRGTAVTIRKFPRTYTWPELVARGMLPPRDRLMTGASASGPAKSIAVGDLNVGDFLRWAVAEARLNLIVSGGTGSGKTTLLNALSGLISHGERLIYIEDAAELQPQQPHVIRLEARPPNTEGRGEVNVRALVKNALRMRPDRIIVGEVRLDEAIDMLQAMNTGHQGSMTTVHANSPRDALTRLETMVLLGSADIPLRAIRQQIAAAVHLIVQVCRDARLGGLRIVQSVSSVQGMDPASGDIVTTDLYRWREGRFRPTGNRPAWDEGGRVS